MPIQWRRFGVTRLELYLAFKGEPVLGCVALIERLL